MEAIGHGWLRKWYKKRQGNGEEEKENIHRGVKPCRNLTRGNQKENNRPSLKTNKVLIGGCEVVALKAAQ